MKVVYHADPVVISGVAARQILDSRGNPTIDVALRLADGTVASASAPAGTSTGANEAVELRDGGGPFDGRGVRRAVAAAQGDLASMLTSCEWSSSAKLDAAMRELDGTGNLQRLGGNTIVSLFLSLSLATGRTFAARMRRQYHEAGLGEEGGLAALTKPNQIGTLPQALEAIRVASENGVACMISHRSGETLDTFIADRAVGTGVGQVKSGAPARGERVAKYNRLSEIVFAHGDLPYWLA